jgi:RHS repeat-associated protein
VIASTSYDSFGNATNSSFPTRYQYTGREYDSLTGLQYSRARWYDAKLGRFISEDPIGFRGGDINTYGYAQNNPLLYFDPLGLDVEVTFSRSQGKITVKENWGGLGIWDWWYGPKSNNEFDVFSGTCQCSETTINQGPIPKGLYLIDKDRDVKGDKPWKRISYRLYASESGTMNGPFHPYKELNDPNTGQKIIRDNFYIHPGSLSYGCITFKKDSNLEDNAPWSSDYEAFDRTLRGTSPIYVRGGAFGGTLTVVD